MDRKTDRQTEIDKQTEIDRQAGVYTMNGKFYSAEENYHMCTCIMYVCSMMYV